MNTVFHKFIVNGEVTRPWYTYLIGTWPFWAVYLTISNYLDRFGDIESRPAIYLLAELASLLFTVLLMVYLFKLKTWAYTFFGVWCSIICVVHFVGFTNRLIDTSFHPAMLSLAVFFLLPSALIALFVVKPKAQASNV